MQQAQTVEHVEFAQPVHHVHDLGHAQAEGGTVAAGIRPVSARFDGQLGPDAELGTNAEQLGALQDHVQFARHFHDEETIEAHALGVQAKVNKLLVLVAVAHQAGFVAAQLGDGRDEFGLGADFQAMMIAFAEFGDVLHHLLLLVDLHRKDAAVFPLVAETLNGFAETVVEQVEL